MRKPKMVRTHGTTFQISKIGRQFKVTFMSSGRMYAAIDKSLDVAIQGAVDLMNARRRKFGLAPR